MLSTIWQICLASVKAKFNHDPTIDYSKHLFYGTNVDPSLMCISEDGWTLRFNETPNERPFGNFPHFSEDAMSMTRFAWKTPIDTRKMFLAEVIVGDPLYWDESSKINPRKLEFDAVVGVHKGSWTYGIIENIRAYPTYIIEYNPSK